MDGTPIIEKNPVAVIKKELANQASKVRTRHIDRRDVGPFWQLLITARQNLAFSADPIAGLDLVMFVLLTGTRHNEGAMLTWDRVKLDDTDPANTWFHLPDPKNRNPVWLPLSSQAVAVLKEREKSNDRATIKSKFAFPSRSAADHIMDTRAPLERFCKEIGMDPSFGTRPAAHLRHARGKGVPSGHRQAGATHKPCAPRGHCPPLSGDQRPPGLPSGSSGHR